MMQPICDLGLNVASSSKQVNLIETEMIGSSCSYPMVGVVTRSKGLSGGLPVRQSNTESSSDINDSSDGFELARVTITPVPLPSKKGIKKVSFQEVHPNALRGTDETFKEAVVSEVEKLHNDAGKPKRQRRRHKRVSKLAKQTEAYDLLGDLGNVKPNITLNQLLMLSPECRRVLSSALVARKEVEQQSVATMTTSCGHECTYGRSGNK